MAEEDRRKLRLSRAKKGLVEGLTKLVHDAAGELVTDALMGLEESPCGRSASARSLSHASVSAGRTDTFRVHDAAGELVTDALMGLEESPCGRSASARS